MLNRRMSIENVQVQPALLLKLYRMLIGIGGTAYLIWWGAVELLLPGSFNPIGSRLAVVFFCWAVLGGSFFSRFLAHHITKGLLVCLGLITVHYFYLFHFNKTDINWVVGSYITIIAVCACLQRISEFWIYAAGVLLLSVALCTQDPLLVNTVFLPGVLTILAFTYFGLRSRLKLLKTLTRKNTELQALNEELGAFSATVSHDLRAPLRAMTAFSHAIIEDHGPELNEEVKQLLTRVIKGGEKMGALIEGLLYMSKITRREVKRTEVNLSELCLKITDELKAEHPARHAVFKIEKNLVVSGDRTLLDAALCNLIHNAWKYSRQVPETVIEFGKRDVNGEEIFFVADNGAGFEMKYAGNLFGLFQRLHAENEFEGNGVGLATVKRIVQKHGGRIWAEAATGKGATFYFTLQELL